MTNEELQAKLADTEKQLAAANSIIERMGEADRLVIGTAANGDAYSLSWTPLSGGSVRCWTASS